VYILYCWYLHFYVCSRYCLYYALYMIDNVSTSCLCKHLCVTVSLTSCLCKYLCVWGLLHRYNPYCILHTCMCWHINYNLIKVTILWPDLADNDLYLGCARFEPRCGQRLSWMVSCFLLRPSKKVTELYLKLDREHLLPPPNSLFTAIRLYTVWLRHGVIKKTTTNAIKIQNMLTDTLTVRSPHHLSTNLKIALYSIFRNSAIVIFSNEQ
jgi:hypothetical protein